MNAIPARLYNSNMADSRDLQRWRHGSLLSRSLVALACRLGLLSFLFLLAILGLNHLLLLSVFCGWLRSLLLCAAIRALDIRVRRGYRNLGAGDLVAVGVDDARPCFVTRLELHAAGCLERFHLLFVQQVAILVAVLDALRSSDDFLALGLELGRPGDSRGALSPVWGILRWLLCRLLGGGGYGLILYGRLRGLGCLGSALGDLVVSLIL
jgi:hypothetical protein